MTRRTVRLDVACNNPDSGRFAGVAQQLEVQTWDGVSVEFEAHGHVPAFTEGKGWIRLHRRRWAFERSRDWYGNWCWNAYWIPPAAALDLLALCKSLGFFHCVSGPGVLYENWNREGPLDRILWGASLLGPLDWILWGASLLGPPAVRAAQ